MKGINMIFIFKKYKYRYKAEFIVNTIRYNQSECGFPPEEHHDHDGHVVVGAQQDGGVHERVVLGLGWVALGVWVRVAVVLAKATLTLLALLA